MKRLLFLLPALVMPVSAQHDPGRDAVRWLAKGAVDKTLERLAKEPERMNSPIDEAEKAFVRMMVACHQNKPGEAFELAKKAVENGLPVTRLQAGSRDLLKPLHNHEAYQLWEALRSTPLVHGPMLGSLTDTSASFWVRTAKEENAEVVVRLIPIKGEGPDDINARATTSVGRDYTAVVQVEGLKPDREYVYQVRVSGSLVVQGQRFRTLPKQGSPSRFQIAFGGGAGYTPQYERMWTTIAGRKPSALLLLGDNVYIDDPEHLLTNDYCYYRRQSEPLWRQLVAKTPVYAIYDDHDFGMNDCVPGPEIEQPPWKRSVWRTFRNNWVNPAYGGGDQQPGCWYDFTIGQVHFLMFDCRYYRDLKGGSMLGPVQKAWLKEQLKSSKGVFKVLVSSVPWSPGVKPGSRDTWDGFPEEREEIFSFLESEKIEGVVLMSADRHRSDYRKIPRPQGYDLHELMSSRLTNVHTHGLMKNAKGSEFIMGYNEKCSFGLVEFDTTVADPTITYTIVNIDNEEVGRRSLKLSELSLK